MILKCLKLCTPKATHHSCGSLFSLPNSVPHHLSLLWADLHPTYLYCLLACLWSHCCCLLSDWCRLQSTGYIAGTILINIEVWCLWNISCMTFSKKICWTGLGTKDSRSKHPLLLTQFPHLVIKQKWAPGVLVQCFDGLDETFIHVELLNHMPQPHIPDSVECLLYWKLCKRSLPWCQCFSIRMQQLKICSTVLPRTLKPTCSSASSSSAMRMTWFWINFSITLRRWLIRLNN